MDFLSVFNVFLNFMNRYCIGLHFTLSYGNVSLEFYPFVYVCVIVITELVFDLFFPRPKGDD